MFNTYGLGGRRGLIGMRFSGALLVVHVMFNTYGLGGRRGLIGMRFSVELLEHSAIILSGKVYRLGKCPFTKTGAITTEFLLP
jgi:hypothetical protein